VKLTLTRAELAEMFPNNPKAVREIEKLFKQTNDNTEAITLNVAGTVALKDATVVTLSPNEELTNERNLALVAPLAAIDEGPGGRLILKFDPDFQILGADALIFNLLGNTNLVLPSSGRLLASDVTDAAYANDAAAAAAGIDVGEVYRVTGGGVAWRQV
jgi:hypothetical protein